MVASSPKATGSKSATIAKPLKRKLSIDGPAQQKRTKLIDLYLDEDYSPSGTSKTKNDESKYRKRQKVSPWALGVRERRALASKLQQERCQMPNSARRGMANLTGSLCYRNSLLQVLMHQAKLVAWLQVYHQPENCLADDSAKCVSCCLRHLSTVYWQASGKQELTEALKRVHILFKTLGWSSDVSSGHADPDEQAGWLFNQIRSELPTSLSTYLDSVQSFATTSVIKCRRCGHESRTESQERSFSVPIQPAIQGGTLAKYLQAYLVETIEGYRCEKCDNKSPKTRWHEIGHAPDILTVQLKRFNWDGRKISRSIPIDVNLDLSRYQPATSNEDPLHYELLGVIKHSGTSGFGHYISAAKGPDASWCEFDDSRKSSSNVNDARSGRSSFTPYILFYQRKD
ncbi:hypothetical protein BP6252_07945 [Coleophoma cylindrospora]|uniref:USP domain-containing protein n=1 Tax=Coleophoma cylindrospora TaxID=1849047 RepID=A0A3D8RBH0_9HELO|nr:hypothetical protein BP6252_07945 [Coleophoma cylindrospora]